MSEMKVTTGWCETEADGWARVASQRRANATEGGVSADGRRVQLACAHDADSMAEALRLAARALRAKEWLRAKEEQGSAYVAVDEFRAEVAAILDGRAP